MNLFELAIEDAGDRHSAAFEAVNQIGSVEAVNVISR